jgi:VWFA-related protein
MAATHNPRMQPAARGLSAVLLALAAATPLPAQAPASPPRFEAGVELVTLPVFVTDKDGQPVSGLTAVDFEVTDEGKPATVVGVQEIDVLEPAASVAAASTSVQAAARRQFLFLFDLSFSNPAGVLRARNAALEFAREGLAPSDLAGVATYSVNGGMRLLLGLTTDREQFARAVETLGVLDGERVSDPLALTYELAPELLDSGRAAGRDSDWVDHMRDQVLALRRGDDARYAQRVGDFLGGLQRLARALDAVGGRKQVVLLSGGFDQSVLMGAQGAQAAQDSEAVITGRLWEVQGDRRFGDANARSVMDEMAKAFAGADTVVHAVDVSGLVARGDPQESVPGMSLGSGRESLNQITGLTGGRLVKDTNDVARALGEIVQASRRYYVLALEPVARGAGRFHRLRVRVRGRPVQVSHRSGYLEPTPDRAVDPQKRRLQSAEAIAKGISGGEIDVGIVAVPYRDAQGRLSLPVVVEVDGASLLAAPSGPELSLEFYGYVFDERGTVVDLVTLTPTLTMSKLGEQLRAGGLQLQTAFAVKPGRYDVRFLVRDTRERMGSRRVEVVVPAFAPGTATLSPPLFMADPAQRVVLTSGSRHNPAPEMPFRVDTDLFTPQGHPTLVNGRTESVCVLAFSPTPFDAKSNFQISAHLTNAAGVRVPIGAPLSVARVVAEPDGFRRFVLKVTPSGLPSGDYTFRVRVKDPLSAEATETAQTLHVR